MILITGYEGYGGRGANPSQQVAQALDGTTIAGHEVRGVVLPVDYAEVRKRVPALIDTHAPVAMISLGLWPGEAVIRLERMGANTLDFEIADQVGNLLSGVIDPDAPAAYRTGLPLPRIRDALRAEGIPSRISDTAGAFLCNALLFTALDHCARTGATTRCGFVHLPYLPEQVAELLTSLADEARLELHQRADLASMSLDMMTAAIQRVITETVIEAETT